MKTKNLFQVVITISFFLCLISRNEANGQSRAKLRDASKNIKEYYYGPVKNGDFVFSMFNTKFDFDSVESEDLGNIILGGLVLSYSNSKSGNQIGVIVINTKNEAVALSVEKRIFKNFLEGKIKSDNLLENVVNVKIDLNSYPQFADALSSW
jgi:hypothetical protein